MSFLKWMSKPKGLLFAICLHVFCPFMAYESWEEGLLWVSAIMLGILLLFWVGSYTYYRRRLKK